ncbi:MAG: hypothetical protein J0G37_04420 [Afipia sp.]|nr:hypothetical protein [Afipia sp.]
MSLALMALALMASVPMLPEFVRVSWHPSRPLWLRPLPRSRKGIDITKKGGPKAAL